MNDAYHVSYSLAALDDLKAAYLYIAFSLKEKAIAAKQINRIRQEIRSLDTMPRRYSKVDWEPWASSGMHKLPVGNYVIFYLVDDENASVTIVRVFYGGRNIAGIVNEETK